MVTRIKLSGLEIESEQNGNVTQVVAQGLQIIMRLAGEAVGERVSEAPLLVPPAPAPALPAAVPTPAHPLGTGPQVPSPDGLPAEEMELLAESNAIRQRVEDVIRAGQRIQPVDDQPDQGRARQRSRRAVRGGLPKASKGKKGVRLVIGTDLDGKDTKPMTPKDAAKLAGSKQVTVKIACAPSSRGKRCGGYQFRWADVEAPVSAQPEINGKPVLRVGRARDAETEQPARRKRRGGRRVIWAKKPGKPLTLDEAAHIASATPSGVSQAVNAGRAIKGYLFTWEDEAGKPNDPGTGDDTDADVADLTEQIDHTPAKSTQAVARPTTFDQEQAGRPAVIRDRSGKAMALNPNRIGSTERPPMPETVARKYVSQQEAMNDAAKDLLEDDE